MDARRLIKPGFERLISRLFVTIEGLDERLQLPDRAGCLAFFVNDQIDVVASFEATAEHNLLDLADVGDLFDESVCVGVSRWQAPILVPILVDCVTSGTVLEVEADRDNQVDVGSCPVEARLRDCPQLNTGYH